MKQLNSDAADVRTTTLSLAGISCGACVRHVTKALDGISGVVQVQVDLQKNEAVVEHLPAYVDGVTLVAAVRDAGYEARVVRTVADADEPPLRPEASASRGSGCCCGGTSKIRDARVLSLGTTTIG
jgi:copper chaperone